MPKHDICFVGLKCYDLLTGVAVPRYLGGIEKILTSLALGLSSAGIRVAFITYDHGQPDAKVVHGVTIYNSFSPDGGLPGVRFFHPRMTKLWSAMRRADASIYLQMGSGSETGRVALGCRYFLPSKRPFIFSLASDNDCDTDIIQSLPVRERLLYLYGLKSANKLVSQTNKQQKNLMSMSGLESTVLAMPIKAPQGVDLIKKSMHPPERHHVLWVGRIIETKRLEFLFEVAKQCPEMIFDVVGTPNEQSRYYDSLTKQAKKLPNIILHGRVEEGILPKLYQETTLLCCTSILEGFPTTFLEAWSYGVPVVTTFDPDNIVANNGLGQVVESMDEMVVALRNITNSRREWLLVAQASFDYFNRHYTLDAVLPKVIELCTELVGAETQFPFEIS